MSSSSAGAVATRSPKDQKVHLKTLVPWPQERRLARA
jgi:hypothetical protein